jgi:hypothetical protein
MMQTLVKKISINSCKYLILICFSAIYGQNKFENLPPNLTFLKNDSLKVEFINQKLADFKAKKDTVSYFSTLAILQKSYLKESNPAIAQVLGDYNLTNYYYKPEISFVFWIEKYTTTLLAVAGILFLTLLVFYFISKRNSLLYWTFLPFISCFFVLNSSLIFTVSPNILHNQQLDVFEKPNFASSSSKNLIAKGELFYIQKEDDLWYEIEFEEKKYYIPKTQKPFVF